MTAIDSYKPRRITFEGMVQVAGWYVKTYCITNRAAFSSHEVYTNAIAQLPLWLTDLGNAQLPVYKQAFLILHEAREGVWILLNWWTGGEMIETKVLFSSFDTPNIITNSPYNTSSLLCVWELEVFAHERRSWIEHILAKAGNPDYAAYTSDTLNVEV